MPGTYIPLYTFVSICFIGFYIFAVSSIRTEKWGTLISNRDTKWRSYTAEREWCTGRIFLFLLLQRRWWWQTHSSKRLRDKDEIWTPPWPPHDAHFQLVFIAQSAIEDEVRAVALLSNLVTCWKKEQRWRRFTTTESTFKSSDDARKCQLSQTWTLMIEIRHCWWACIHPSIFYSFQSTAAMTSFRSYQTLEMNRVDWRWKTWASKCGNRRESED